MPDDKRPKRPRDINQLAHQLVQESIGERIVGTPASAPAKNPAAVALGKLGAAKGGAASAKKLSPKKRKEIAKKAAQARWSKKENV